MTVQAARIRAFCTAAIAGPGGPGCSVPRCGGTFPVFAARVAVLVIVLAADLILSVTRGGAWMAEAGKREVE
jgi:hypothetical protein